MSEQLPAIVIEGLSKRYRRGSLRSDNLRNSLKDLFRIRKKESFLALSVVNLSIQQGEVVGIIGSNGAGKTTLLKIISRITPPSEGRITLQGRVASLLEVGTGFHPELTGRENVFLNGSILGMSKAEIRKRFDEIVEFAGIGDFIDTPVKHYSSGMYVRLAFSVAAHLDSDILLVDEVLSVGDSAFRKKSLKKMEQVSTGGRTVLFVSHNLGMIRQMCDRTLWLENGAVKMMSPTSEVLTHYLAAVSEVMSTDLSTREDRQGDGSMKLKRVAVENAAGGVVRSGDGLQIELIFDVREVIHEAVCKLFISDHMGTKLIECNSRVAGTTMQDIQPGSVRLGCTIPELPLNAGKYTLGFVCRTGYAVYDQMDAIATFDVEQGDFYPGSLLPGREFPVLVKQKWAVIDAGK